MVHLDLHSIAAKEEKGENSVGQHTKKVGD
jgi:hypothetical protein